MSENATPIRDFKRIIQSPKTPAEKSRRAIFLTRGQSAVIMAVDGYFAGREFAPAKK